MSLGDKRPPQPSALANEEASSSLLVGVAERWRTSLVCGLGGQEDRRTEGPEDRRTEGQDGGGLLSTPTRLDVLLSSHVCVSCPCFFILVFLTFTESLA